MIHSPDRLTTPLIRRNGVLEEATWDEALSLVADPLRGDHETVMAPRPSGPSARPAAPTRTTG